jgi:hypothetical protein
MATKTVEHPDAADQVLKSGRRTMVKQPGDAAARISREAEDALTTAHSRLYDVLALLQAVDARLDAKLGEPDMDGTSRLLCMAKDKLEKSVHEIAELPIQGRTP